MVETVSFEHRLAVLEGRVKFLQIACGLLIIFVIGVGILQRRELRSGLFTDSLTIPSRFWAAPSFLNVGTNSKVTAITLGRLSSNEQVRIESGSTGTSITFWDARSKKRLALGLSTSGEPFLLSFDRAGNSIPAAIGSSSVPNGR